MIARLCNRADSKRINKVEVMVQETPRKRLSKSVL
jgi:hypothetical protein